MSSEKITTAQYAESRKKRGLPGGTVPGVLKAGATGRITITDGMVDPAVADFEWEKNTRKRIDFHGSTPEPSVDSPTHDRPSSAAMPGWGGSKAREAAAKAELMEIELAERKGALIDRAGYERAAHKSMRMLRDALVDTLPAKIAMELASLTDPWTIECRLREAIRGELTAISGLMRQESNA